MKRNITLITMGMANVLVLKKTLESFKHVCNEVIYGDLLVWSEDREIVKTYQEEYNLKFVKLPFNFIFKNGFSATLNELAHHATNDLVLYMNTSEIIDEDYGISEIIENNPDCNTFYFTHRTEPHRWFRMYDKRELQWSGLIHEEVVGEHRPYHKPIFMMADLEKDMEDEFKARVANTVKEIVYFQQYVNIVDNPKLLGATNSGWLNFAINDYESFKYRLNKNGKRYEAFVEGDIEKFMKDINENPEFENERFKSSILLEYQGDPLYLGK